MSDLDRVEAEAKVLRLEEALVEAKQNDNDYEELKYELREARREFRQVRQGGTVNPDALRAQSEVE